MNVTIAFYRHNSSGWMIGEINIAMTSFISGNLDKVNHLNKVHDVSSFKSVGIK